MIPSLVASELKESIVEYLATTFALTDDEAYEALSEFLLDDVDGIFRGPFLRVRLPFVEAPADADPGLVWTPSGFAPYVHQLTAWQRLAGRNGTPKSTLITTGTGSGKSEAFLMPIVDHCVWAREQGLRGIKALILYPMNALVTDQERRIAQLLTDPVLRSAGVTGGVWIGDDGSTSPHRDLSAEHLITDHATLAANPPDILLTNYKMLDRLLTTEARQRLWAANTPPVHDTDGWQQPLRYVVLDEFHTYDGAQGTDVAMLLRRLGHRLGISTKHSPLQGVACVGTSATLGSSPTAMDDMCGFASRVFGQHFDTTAVVGEQRRSVDEVCPVLDFASPVPHPAEVAALKPTDDDGLALAFTGVGFDDAQAVGDRLLRHPITAALLRVVSTTPRSWGDVVVTLAAQVPQWSPVLDEQPESLHVALERFVGLVSRARGRTPSGGERPLFAVEVQVWVREVSRLTRAISQRPRFRWSDSPGANDTDAQLELPAVYCTACGRSGWLGVANRAAGQGQAAIERLEPIEETDPYVASVKDRERTRTLLRAAGDEPDVLWLDPMNGQVFSSDDANTRIAVLVAGMTGDERSAEARDEAAKQQRCPSCGTRDAIRFLGSRVTTLASVGITQLFGSDVVADEERKLLAFTDSVQDASHRAAFFSGRTHKFNLRATLARGMEAGGRVALPDVAATVLGLADAEPEPAVAVFSLIPPDLVLEEWLADSWQHHGTPRAAGARAALTKRLGFDAVMEAGLRARMGRTLETTGTAVAEVRVSDEEWERLEAFAAEAIRSAAGQYLVDAAAVRAWIHGVVERVRLRGGIFHEFLDRYVATNGKRWEIWGGGDPIAPKFPRGISAPAFPASVPGDEFDPISGAQSWMVQWTRKVLGVDTRPAELVIVDVLHELVTCGVLQRRQSERGAVWGLPQERIEFVRIATGEAGEPATELRCSLCANRHYVSPDGFSQWIGRPCMRVRCTGLLEPAAHRGTNYYRKLYRSGRIRKVVAAEHTGLLNQDQRERIEQGFKRGGTPDAPNVLTATPTLEMGIDIGDLSAVMLTAVPPTQANYVQRVGRAGRRTGNAFVATMAEADPRSLYFLHEPEQMIAGDITAPNCYLDAIEILRRQYLAFLVDQAARRGTGLVPDLGPMPFNIGQLMSTGMAPGGWLTRLLDAGRNSDVVAEFVSLFGTHLDPRVTMRLRDWTRDDMVDHVEARLGRWKQQLEELRRQRNRLRDREKDLKALVNPSDEDTATLARIGSELRYVARRITQTQNDNTLSALEALGLLPNYTLFDDTVTLEVNLWEPNPRFDPADETSRRIQPVNREYSRAATVAIRELAPGNYFYVDAHKVRIDAVDVGTEHEPAYSLWRLCPDCGWSSRDVANTVNACPRCGSPTAADNGSLVTVLPMRLVSSTERERSSRVGDDTEDRDREWHEVLTTVDIDPRDIEDGSAYLHASGVGFGVEAARSARIRYLNLGLQAGKTPTARQLRINGKEVSAGMFTVCRLCGGVQGIRGDARDPADPNHHRSWCKVRSGARKPVWDDVALAHELTTEAVRILVPVAEFEATERLQSFKAALMLGLRDSFGGDPNHLRVLDADFPAANDRDMRVRYVVVHDSVPGGTGYLLRLADPARLEKILRRARDLIANCDCQTRGRTGCHKCLYNSVGRRDIPFVTRRHALGVLDEILKDWALEPAAQNTITGINLSKVRQSELERMFKVLLQRWSELPGATLAAAPDPADPALTRFDIRFDNGVHWRVREQVNLAQHATIPDFYAERLDRPHTAPVAIYLDGWEFHGANPVDTTRDAALRSQLRGDGIRVWALSWNDVDAALKAVGQHPLGACTPVPAPVRTRIRQQLATVPGGAKPAHDAIDLGAFDQLILALQHPDAGAWRQVAEVLAVGGAFGVTPVHVADLVDAVDAVGEGREPAPAAAPTGRAALVWASNNGQKVAAFIERDTGGVAAVCSFDSDQPAERSRWTDWLHLGNLLQYLDGGAVVSSHGCFTPGNGIVLGATQTPAPPVSDTLDVLDAAVFDDILDAVALDLARMAADAGFTDFVVGESAGDADDTPLEVWWQQRGVGIVAASTPAPRLGNGATVKPSSDWTVEELMTALSAGGS